VRAWLDKSVTGSPGQLLKVAADVANVSKHLKLVHPPQADGSSQTRAAVEVFVNHGIRMTFYVQDARVGGDEYEALDLAEQCISQWRDFLTTVGLSPPSPAD
jgi:hypothetical protein